jgi:hypothetical protein
VSRSGLMAPFSVAGAFEVIVAEGGVDGVGG